VEVVARELRVRCDMLVVAVGWFDFGFPDDLFDDVERTHGVHGGAIETSMMLHLRPDLVRMDRAEMFSSLSMALERNNRFLIRSGRMTFAWMAQDLNPLGVCGDAKAATADSGAKLVEHAARGLVQLLQEIDRMPLSILKPAT
jgi:creatinine amidohydrolase